MGGGNFQSSNAYPSQQGYGSYQGKPNPNAQGYRPNQQAYVPPYVKNDNIPFPSNQGDQSNSSSSTQDMMYQMMTNLMAKMNGMESKIDSVEENVRKQENITSFVSQMVNTQAQEELKREVYLPILW